MRRVPPGRSPRSVRAAEELGEVIRSECKVEHAIAHLKALGAMGMST